MTQDRVEQVLAKLTAIEARQQHIEDRQAGKVWDILQKGTSVLVVALLASHVDVLLRLRTQENTAMTTKEAQALDARVTANTLNFAFIDRALTELKIDTKKILDGQRANGDRLTRLEAAMKEK